MNYRIAIFVTTCLISFHRMHDSSDSCYRYRNSKLLYLLKKHIGQPRRQL